MVHKRILMDGRMWTGLNWLRKIIHINIKELNIYLVEFAFLDVPTPDSAILFLRTDVTYLSSCVHLLFQSLYLLF